MNGFEVMFNFHFDWEGGPVGPARSNPSWHLTRVTSSALFRTQEPRRTPLSLSLGSLGGSCEVGTI